MSKQNAAKSTSTKTGAVNGQHPQALTIRDVLLESIEAQKSIEAQQKRIEKVEDKISEVRQSVADHLMVAAKPFGGDYDRFNAACKEHMAWLKSDEAGKHKVDKIPRCFVQAKSDIIGAMKEGLKPQDFQSYSKLKEAKIETRKSGNTSGETVKVDTNTDLGAALQELFAVVKRIPEEYQPQAAQAIKHLAADLAVQYELQKEQDEQEQEQEQEAPKEAASA